MARARSGVPGDVRACHRASRPSWGAPRIRQKKPSGAELQRTKDYLLGNFRLGFEQPRTRLFYFGLGVLTYGRIVPAAETAARIADVSADEVLAVAQDILRDDRRAVSWVVPKAV